MNGRVVRPGSCWDHREGRWVVHAVRPPSGRDSPAARAFAERAANANDAEAFREPHYASVSTSTDGPVPGANAVLVDVAAGLAAGTALYFHSPVAMDRDAVLHRAAAAVAPGGMLLVVDHASVHPWSWADPDTGFPSPGRP